MRPLLFGDLHRDAEAAADLEWPHRDSSGAVSVMKSLKAAGNMLILAPGRFKQSSYAGSLYTVAKRQIVSFDRGKCWNWQTGVT
jgi:hypothetical protein